MVMITVTEIWRMVIVTVALGYIFSVFLPSKVAYRFRAPVSMENIKLAIFIAAPGIILHELAHKFVALALGLKAEFFASYFGLAIGLILRIVHSPLLIIVPGYVAIHGTATPIQSGIVAFAGPLINLVLWLGSGLALKTMRLKRKSLLVLYLTKKVNMILFLFNMIPLGFFDGAKVLDALLYALKS